jgi:hypothetical protein
MSRPPKVLKTKHEPVLAVVQRQYQQNGAPVGRPQTSNETLEVRQFVTEPAKVGVNMGLTLNLGNFESARIDVSLSIPCYSEETDAAYLYAKDWVEKRLNTEVQSVRANKPSLF